MNTSKKRKIRRGDIFMADLNLKGNLQKGLRPYLVVSNNLNNQLSPVVTVVALTSRRKKKQLPTHVKIKIYNEIQKRHVVNIVLAEQIFSVNKSELQQHVGFVPHMVAVNVALRIHLAL